jgi:hypothetical protein
VWREKMAEMVANSGVSVGIGEPSGEDKPHRQYAERRRQGSGSQACSGNLDHGELPALQRTMNAPAQDQFTLCIA